MAAVLFIVTIPTEAEELRLQQTYIAKKYDIKSDRNDCTSATLTPNTTTTDVKITSAGANNPPPTSVAVTNPSLNNSIGTITTASNTINPTTNTTTAAEAAATATAGVKSGQPLVDIPNAYCSSNNSETASTTVNDYHDTHSMTSGVVCNETPTAQQFGTFPKRKLSKLQSSKAVENSSGPATNTEDSSESLKDMATKCPTSDSTTASRKSWDGIREILSSSRRKSLRKKSQAFELELSQDTCMEIVLRELLKRFHIRNAVWSKDEEGRMHQIFFTIEFNETYEKFLDNLNEWGIGDREGSTITVMSCLASKTFCQDDDKDVSNDCNAENSLEQKQGAWERFMNSVRSRLNVAQVVRNVRQDAAISFDFVVLLLAAAILASFGLIEDSTIFLASSMLISPLMGPIIAAIFGTVIKDHSLRQLGLKNELFGIFTAVMVGFSFGLIICVIDAHYGIAEGMTDEMLSRCDLHSLVVGVFTAVASGAAAAIGILGSNIGSLVGVAISASLLPPAVNSGLIWSLAAVYKIYEKDPTRFNTVVTTTVYSQDQAIELAVMGSISMCLTISNILCIYVMGILVLKIKEIAPAVSRSNREFWKRDIKIARNLSRNGYDTDTAIIDEIANLPKEDRQALGINYDFWQNINPYVDDSTYQHTWSPFGHRQAFEAQYNATSGNYSTVHRLERLYSTLSNQQTVTEKRNRFSLSKRTTSRFADPTNSYKKLSENVPRLRSQISVPTTLNILGPDATLTTGGGVSKQATSTITPTTKDERKRRKFIVTPAEEDPLQLPSHFDEVDV